MKKTTKWNKDSILKEALKYKTRSEFQNNNRAAYKAAQKLNIIEIVCSHMPKHAVKFGEKSPNFRWTDEDLRKEALKYKTRGEFQRKSVSYGTAHKRGILDEICSHMPKHVDQSNKNNPNFKWTDEQLEKETLKYKTKKEFKKNRPIWAACQRRGLLEKLCLHMETTRSEWTKESIAIEALKYNNRSEFALKSPKAYAAAAHRKIVGEVCSHMKASGGTSRPERELFGIIRGIFPNTESVRDATVKIKGKPHIKGFDIDIFVPELNLGIEFDGTWTHSFKGLKRGRKHWPDEDIRNYHKLKDGWFKTKGIKILHIKQKDWDRDKESCIKKCLDFLKSG